MVGPKIPWKTNPGPISEERGSNVHAMTEVSNVVSGVTEWMNYLQLLTPPYITTLISVQKDHITAHRIFHLLNPLIN